MILDDSGQAAVSTRVLRGGRQEGQSQRREDVCPRKAHEDAGQDVSLCEALPFRNTETSSSWGTLSSL